jgi:hypothetical protein
MLSIQYRGPLASCNYDCAYCPFAKRRDGPAALTEDRRALAHFVEWVRAFDDEVAILFTPWGEALTRRWYRDAMVELSLLPQVRRVAAQTNLSWPVGWTAAAKRSTFGLWCTYHPGQARRERFVARSHDLVRLGIEHSVGVVGFPEHLDEARCLRAELDPGTYLWINPAGGLGRAYTDAEVTAWARIDPLFQLALGPHDSAGRPCRAGQDAVSIDGTGAVRRCHFVAEPLGNIHDGSFARHRERRPCPNDRCDCFIGYIHRDADRYDALYGAGLLVRSPTVRRNPAERRPEPSGRTRR